MREIKSTLPGSIKGIDGRSITGICAVMGNIDSVRDRLHMGAFAKTIKEAGRNAKHLWNHSFQDPPIAVIKNLQEVGRDALPAEVLEYAPEASGGLEVTREYLNTPRADEVFEGVSKGAINQMSFAYDSVKADYTKEGEGPDYLTVVRELREVKLFDTSDVNWGCNDATAASKALQAIELSRFADSIKSLIDEVRAGRRTKAAIDRTQLKAIQGELEALLTVVGEEEATEEEKSRAGTEGTDAPVSPLTLQKHRAQLQSFGIALID